MGTVTVDDRSRSSDDGRICEGARSLEHSGMEEVEELRKTRQETPPYGQRKQASAEAQCHHLQVWRTCPKNRQGSQAVG